MSSELEELVSVRSHSKEDINFILATFKRSLYYDNDYFNLMPKNEFMSNYSIIADALLRLGKIRIACLKNYPDVILGYSITNPSDTVLHWVYVRVGADPSISWRKKGLTKLLLPSSIAFYTHFTNLGLSILRQKKLNISFNPFKS